MKNISHSRFADLTFLIINSSAYFMRHQNLTDKNIMYPKWIAFMCFLYIAEQTAIIFLYRIN